MRVGGGIVMNARRIFAHRLDWVEDGRQLFIFDLYEAQRLLCAVERLGGHCDHLFSDEADLVARQHRTIEEKAAKQNLRQISAGHYRMNSGYLLCLRDIDRDD